MLKLNLLALLPALLLVNCAHHRDVRPGEKGINTVILQTERGEGNYREARSQAEHFCELFKKVPIILKEKSKYSGTMDEKSYNTYKSVAKGAKVAGSVAWIAGGTRESNAGGLVGIGGMAGDAYLGDGYTYQMRFKCKRL